MVRRGLIAAAVASAGILVTGGCGTGTEDVISDADLEQGVADALRKANTPPEDLDCDGPVKAQIAEITTCTMSADGVDYEVEVVVTAVDGGSASYEIELKQAASSTATESAPAGAPPSQTPSSR
ncbi:DUF4333 domain-containing protein [Haloechinothrix salitolerans]|uniref:DUF4333 domain-containing protein n=1 Tax=Haloechinothrix salitolerans TaxID=926830 RepID=A0ABW2BS05_9PSEU